MKISEAQSIYRQYRQDLISQTEKLVKKRDQAKAKYESTGSAEFSEEAATLELSLETVETQFNENQKVLDSLSDQYTAVWNAEVAKQQGDAANEMGKEISKIMIVAQRLAQGAQVPYTDEKKLMEYSPELYQAAKSAQMLHELEEKKKYDSLWDEEEEPTEYDPEGKAENAEVQGSLPEIPVPDAIEGTESES